MPLTSDECGNSTGSPLAVNQNTNRPRIILHDPEGAARRNRNTGLAIVGEPGSGKSNRAKLSAVELALRGRSSESSTPASTASGTTAFRSFSGVQAIDPTRSDMSLDPLVIFPYEEAAAKAGDHILPVIGVDPRSIMRAQFEVALRPDNRERNGIRRMRDLIEYLRDTTQPARQ